MSWKGVLQAFDAQMGEPELFGWFQLAPMDEETADLFQKLAKKLIEQTRK